MKSSFCTVAFAPERLEVMLMTETNVQTCIMRRVGVLLSTLFCALLTCIHPVNIQTHLLGALLFVGLLGTFYHTYLAPYETVAWQDLVVFAIFLSAAVFCLLASSWYHTFSVHSREVWMIIHSISEH